MKIPEPFLIPKFFRIFAIKGESDYKIFVNVSLSENDEFHFTRIFEFIFNESLENWGRC
jgi:hypothetical protein